MYQQNKDIKMNTSLPISVRLYKDAECTSSSVGECCIIGDNSRVRYSNLGDYVRVDRNTLIQQCEIGKRTYTGPFDMIFNAKIGSYTSISYGVTIGPPEHNYHKTTAHPFIYDSFFGIVTKDNCLRNDKFDKPIEIRSDVWIGANVTILRGVHIGDGAVIGANALVNKDVPPYAIVAGCPARIIKYRFTESVIQKLLELQWWLWSDEKIKRNLNLFFNEPTMEKLSLIE